MNDRQKFMLIHINRVGSAILLDFQMIWPEFVRVDLMADLRGLCALGLITKNNHGDNRATYEAIK